MYASLADYIQQVRPDLIEAFQTWGPDPNENPFIAPAVAGYTASQWALPGSRRFIADSEGVPLVNPANNIAQEVILRDASGNVTDIPLYFPMFGSSGIQQEAPYWDLADKLAYRASVARALVDPLGNKWIDWQPDNSGKYAGFTGNKDSFLDKYGFVLVAGAFGAVAGPAIAAGTFANGAALEGLAATTGAFDAGVFTASDVGLGSLNAFGEAFAAPALEVAAPALETGAFDSGIFTAQDVGLGNVNAFGEPFTTSWNPLSPESLARSAASELVKTGSTSTFNTIAESAASQLGAPSLIKQLAGLAGLAGTALAGVRGSSSNTGGGLPAGFVPIRAGATPAGGAVTVPADLAPWLWIAGAVGAIVLLARMKT